MAETIDMSLWQGRTDPEPDSPRWHQQVRPLEDGPAGVALLGFRSDAGVRRNRGRPGACQGPKAIRQALANLAWHRRGPAYDAGDIHCEGDALEDAQRSLGDRVAHLLDAGHFPVVLGGGHEVAFGCWQGLASFLAAQGTQPKLGIINFDAHLDLRDPAAGASSGTPFAQIAGACQERDWPFRYACLGVSRASNTRALLRRADQLEVLVREDRAIRESTLTGVTTELQAFMAACDHLYLTIDLDVLPAFEAPGVSAPAARGVPLGLIEPLIETVRDSGKLRLADIAELNPDYDIDHRTARAAARLVWTLTQP